MIAIVDYHAGNLTSVAAAVRSLGHVCQVTSDSSEIGQAERVILPGVGAAGAAMRSLSELGLVDVLRAVVGRGRPFLGICLGYQVLFQHSEEDDASCLGILDGTVVRFRESIADGGQPLKIPQMGWNTVEFVGEHALWEGVPENSEFYFVHSYYPVPAPALVAATAEYGVKFAAGVVRRNLAAFQFHPEKSGRSGLRLLDNFCRWRPA